MTGKPTAKPRRYELDCRHVLWLTVPPMSSDVLWCVSCGAYQPLLLGVGSSHGEIYDAEGQFKTERINSKSYVATCLFEDCRHFENRTSYQASINAMHKHYMRSHTKWEIKTVDRVTSKLPPNSDPPF